MGFLKQALKYNSLGWSIIPIKPQDKRPAISSWEQYQNRLATKEEIEKWFTNTDYNIALITGKISGVDVVDVDSYKGKGEFKIDSPIKVNTPRGGTHYYFKHVDGVRPGVNADLGVDLRGDGSYVLIPPSLGPNGNKYEWKKGGELNSLPTTPKEVVEKIKKSGINEPSFNLEDSMNVTQGGRNDALHKASVSLISKHGPELAWKLILGVNSGYSPPLPEREVMITFNSAAKFVENHPPIGGKRNAPPPVIEHIPEIEWKEPTLKEDLERVKKILREGKQIGYPTGYPELDNIMGGLIPGQSYLFFGDTNTGKSILVLNILVYLSKNDIKCLYFDLENSMVMTAERQLLITEEGRLTKRDWEDAIKDKKADEYIDKLRSYPLRVYDINKMYDRFGVIDYDSVEKVMNEALASGVQVIAIDHLHYFEPTEQNFNLLANISRRINDFCSQNNLVVIMIAHTKKGLLRTKNDKIVADRPTLDSVAGAGLITRHTKNVVAIRRNSSSGDPVEQKTAWIYVDKTKSGPTGSFSLEFDPDTLIFKGNHYDYNPLEVMKKVDEVQKMGVDNIDDIM